jgi:hypothetical protein
MIGTEDFGPRDLHGWVRGRSGERVVGPVATTLTELESADVSGGLALALTKRRSHAGLQGPTCIVQLP